jgi:lactoylglutathione lyase
MEEGCDVPHRLLHTMLRVRDLDRTLTFYVGGLGMTVRRRSEYAEGRFTLVFVGYAEDDAQAVLEFTHNWDVSDYDEGDAFGHIAVAVGDAYGACIRLETLGFQVVRPAGPMRFDPNEVIAFVEDPDGRSVELVQRS